MTLILSLITDDFVCQVSDRRLTDASTGQEIDTKASKTVVVPPVRLMCSYTGLAHVAADTTTDEWLMRTLFDLRESDDYFGAIAQEATETFRKIVSLSPRQKRHAFVLLGWLRDDVGGVPDDFIGRPFYTIISNFFDFQAGRWLPDASEDFSQMTRPLYPAERFLIFPAGAVLTEQETAALEADVASALRSSTGRERAASVRLLRALEDVGTRDPTVGGGAFISALSREFDVAHEPEPDRRGLKVLGVRWGLPEAGAATFVHVPDEPSEVVESPAVVGDPFAGKGTVRVTRGDVPSLAGAGGVPEEGSFEFQLIALRDIGRNP